jgi:hypothetical protein
MPDNFIGKVWIVICGFIILPLLIFFERLDS